MAPWKWHLSRDQKGKKVSRGYLGDSFVGRENVKCKDLKVEDPDMLKREQWVQCHWGGTVEGKLEKEMRLGKEPQAWSR